MKLYDFDGMFDEKLKNYIEKNVGKYTEEEWEDVIPKLYARFGNTPVKSIGLSPIEYYKAMSDEELVNCLRMHLKQGVPVSKFLCKSFDDRNADSLLLPLLYGTDDEIIYAMNILGSSDCAIPRYMEMLISPDSDEDRKNECVDRIKEKADLVKDTALNNYKNGIECEYMLEILSRCVLHDDDIFNTLVKEFRCADDTLALRANYLAVYGDERALPYLLEKIDDEDITFIEFQELKFAIESLGGTYTKERDFSGDEYYELIKSQPASSSAYDLFNHQNKKTDD